MNFSNLIRPAQKFVQDNTSVILTGVGVSGVVATSVLTGKATIKAYEVVQTEKAARGPGEDELFQDETPDARDLTNKDIFRLTWHLYVPAVGVGTATILCIIFAHRISAKEAAALAAAYTLSENKFTDYREKVRASFGEGKERKVREEVAQDKMQPVPTTIIIGGGKVLCKDVFSDRYFESTVEGIRKAVNDFNQQLMIEMDMSLTDFYNMLDIPKTGYSDTVGWSTEDVLDVDILTTLTPDGQPCVTMDFAVEPKPRINFGQ